MSTHHDIIQAEVHRIAQLLFDGPVPIPEKLGGANILITGGAGFLGKYFLNVFKHLNDVSPMEPCKVYCVDNFITGSKDGLVDDPNFQYSTISAVDIIVDPMLAQIEFDYIIHAAGIASPVYYMKYPLETAEVAVYGVHSLLDFAAKQKNLKKFIFFSSSEIYGDPDGKNVPTPETYKGNVSCTGPRSCYDESKRFAETLCEIYRAQKGIPVCVIRPFNVYGPGMRPDDYRAVPAFITHGMNGQDIPVHGTGEQTRTFCYITDAMNGFLRALLFPGAAGFTFNIGTPGPEITMHELANMICRALNVDNTVQVQCIEYPATYPADEPLRRCPDLTRASDLLSYAPTVSLEEGIAQTIAWYRALNA